MKKLQLLTLFILGIIFCTTLISVAAQSQVAEFNIRISLDRAEQKIVMSCTEGCTWETANFWFGPDMPDSAEINGRGTITPALPE